MSGLRRNSWRLTVVGAALVIGGSIGFATASSPGDPDAPPNPGEDVARHMTDDGTLLVRDASSGQVCLVTRLGRGSGSSCTSLKATDILVSYTTSETGYVLGVFDPAQRAETLVADGQALGANTRTEGTLTYFATAGSVLPAEIEVMGPDGQVLARFTPASDVAEARALDMTATSHD